MVRQAALEWPLHRTLAQGGVPRSMKMGNIASPWRYDNAAENAIEATLMR
jgi:hypothetical protein